MKTRAIKISMIVTMSLLLLLQSCTSTNEKADAYGNFEAREIMVSAETQGRIIRLNLEEGELLKAGDQVGIIDSSTLAVKRQQLVAKKRATASKLENIDAKVAVQKEQIKTYKIELNRIQKLLRDEAATEQQYDNIAGKFRVAKKQLRSIQTQKTSVYQELNVIDAQIQEIEENLEKCRIINPKKGTVLEKYHEPGEFTMPGKVIYKLADLSSLFLRVYITGAQLPDVKIGQEATVFIDKNEQENQELTGKVTWISSKAEFTPKIIQTKEERVDLVYAVKVKVKNDGRLKIGMPGEVYF